MNEEKVLHEQEVSKCQQLQEIINKLSQALKDQQVKLDNNTQKDSVFAQGALQELEELRERVSSLSILVDDFQAEAANSKTLLEDERALRQTAVERSQQSTLKLEQLEMRLDEFSNMLRQAQTEALAAQQRETEAKIANQTLEQKLKLSHTELKQIETSNTELSTWLHQAQAEALAAKKLNSEHDMTTVSNEFSVLNQKISDLTEMLKSTQANLLSETKLKLEAQGQTEAAERKADHVLLQFEERSNMLQKTQVELDDIRVQMVESQVAAAADSQKIQELNARVAELNTLLEETHNEVIAKGRLLEEERHIHETLSANSATKMTNLTKEVTELSWKFEEARSRVTEESERVVKLTDSTEILKVSLQQAMDELTLCKALNIKLENEVQAFQNPNHQTKVNITMLFL